MLGIGPFAKSDAILDGGGKGRFCFAKTGLTKGVGGGGGREGGTGEGV